MAHIFKCLSFVNLRNYFCSMHIKHKIKSSALCQDQNCSGKLSFSCILTTALQTLGNIMTILQMKKLRLYDIRRFAQEPL